MCGPSWRSARRAGLPQRHDRTIWFDGRPMTTRATEPKQDRSRQTRQRILEATVESLRLRGWEGTTMAAVAADAGTSRGALQHHFPTREDLTAAALDFMFEQRSAGLDAMDVKDLRGVERVRAVTELMVDVYMSTLFDAALQVWTVAAVDESLRARIEPLEGKFGREVHNRTVALLGVDGRDPVVRGLVQATLDLGRGLALANQLSDDSKRRAAVLDAWAPQLAAGLGLLD